MRKLLWLLLFFSLPLFAQVSPQIQGAGAPSNPCTNGGQDYVDQTNHVLYHCPSSGSNWALIGLGNLASNTALTSASGAPAGNCPSTNQVYVNTANGDFYDCPTPGSAWNKVSTAGGTGTVTSVTLTGDGTVLSATPSAAVTTSGTLTAALANAGAGTILGNPTGSAAAPAYTATPLLGLAGTTLGTLRFQNATSGTVTLQPVAGALGTVTVSLPAAAGTVAVSATAPITESATGAVGCATCATTSNGGALSATAPITISAAGVIAGTTLGTDTNLVTGTGVFSTSNMACGDANAGVTPCTAIPSSMTAGAALINSGFIAPARIVQSNYSSGTVTGAITATTLCSQTNCPAGDYQVSIYFNETGTGCTTVGSGAAVVKIGFIDNQAVTRTAIVPVPLSSNTGSMGTLGSISFSTAGTNFDSMTYFVNTNGSAVAATDSLQIQTTVTACTTPGSWTGYQIRADVLRLR